MVIWRETDFNVECFHDVLVKIRYKRITIVRDRRFAKAEPGRPLHEGFATFR